MYEAQSYAGDYLGWRAEVMARLRDLLSRKAVPASERVAEKFTQLFHQLGSAVPAIQFKSAIRDLLASLKRERPQDVEDSIDRELDALFLRIRGYGERESIQNYTAYLFSMDVRI